MDYKTSGVDIIKGRSFVEYLKVLAPHIAAGGLDAVGDLMLAGAPIAGVYEARQPGHALNNKLVRALLDAPASWCWESDEDEAVTGAAVAAGDALNDEGVDDVLDE